MANEQTPAEDGSHAELGPLPEPPLCRDDTQHDVDYYTADQMRAYAMQERAAERERIINSLPGRRSNPGRRPGPP